MKKRGVAYSSVQVVFPNSIQGEGKKPPKKGGATPTAASAKVPSTGNERKKLAASAVKMIPGQVNGEGLKRLGKEEKPINKEDGTTPKATAEPALGGYLVVLGGRGAPLWNPFWEAL